MNEQATRTYGPNDFVRTAPDTIMGRYMRLFWQPVFVGRDLPAGRAKPLRIMNEDFAIYRGENGVAQILAPRCAHRCTQLSTGWVEGNALRCFYHGWKYDPSGQCVEAPAEREGFADNVRIRSYPTQEYLGLIFAFLGDGDAPPFPHYPVFDKEGVVTVSSYVRDCNCYNNLESNMDSLHTAFVHRNSAFTTAGLNWALPEISGEETDYRDGHLQAWNPGHARESYGAEQQLDGLGASIKPSTSAGTSVPRRRFDAQDGVARCVPRKRGRHLPNFLLRPTRSRGKRSGWRTSSDPRRGMRSAKHLLSSRFVS